MLLYSTLYTITYYNKNILNILISNTIYVYICICIHVFIHTLTIVFLCVCVCFLQLSKVNFFIFLFFFPFSSVSFTGLGVMSDRLKHKLWLIGRLSCACFMEYWLSSMIIQWRKSLLAEGSCVQTCHPWSSTVIDSFVLTLHAEQHVFCWIHIWPFLIMY